MKRVNLGKLTCWNIWDMFAAWTSIPFFPDVILLIESSSSCCFLCRSWNSSGLPALPDSTANISFKISLQNIHCSSRETYTCSEGNSSKKFKNRFASSTTKFFSLLLIHVFCDGWRKVYIPPKFLDDTCNTVFLLTSGYDGRNNCHQLSLSITMLQFPGTVEFVVSVVPNQLKLKSLHNIQNIAV